MPRNCDSLIDALYQLLSKEPQDSLAAIAKKLRQDVRRIKEAMAHLRKNCKLYGWTIPHVDTRSSEVDASQKGKYFVVLLKKDGSHQITDEKRLHYTRGAHISLQRVATLLMNEAEALLSCGQNERSQVKKHMLESIVKDMRFVEDKARDVAKLFSN